MAMKHYPPKFKAEAVAVYRSRQGATIKSVAEDLGSTPRSCRTRFGSMMGDTPGLPAPAGRPWRRQPRPRVRMPCCATGFASWRRSGTSCARRGRRFAGRRAGGRFQFVADHQRRYITR